MYVEESWMIVEKKGKHAHIPKGNTLFGAKLKFSFVVRTEMRPTGTPKDFKEIIIQDCS
jgi:hypothetical protein